MRSIWTGRARRSLPSRVLQLASALGIVLSLTACPSGDHDPPKDLLRDPADLLRLVSRRASGLSTLAVEARATQYSDDRVIKGKVAILVRRPGAIRFTALSPTDDVVSVMATDGARFTAFERGAEVCYTGRACADNVGHFIPVPMETEQLAGVLMGRPPFIDHGHAELRWDRRVGAYLLELEGAGDRLQRAWVRPSGEVLRAQLLRGGALSVELRYADFAPEGGYSLPHRLDVKMTHGDVDLRLVYRQVDVDLPLDDAAFSLDCPRGTQVDTLPCPGEGSAMLAPEATPPQ